MGGLSRIHRRSKLICSRLVDSRDSCHGDYLRSNDRAFTPYGFKTKWAAWASGTLTLIFAIAMAISFGIKEPLDYSVFVDSAAAFMLATNASPEWAIDGLISKRRNTTNQ